MSTDLFCRMSNTIWTTMFRNLIPRSIDFLDHLHLTWATRITVLWPSTRTSIEVRCWFRQPLPNCNLFVCHWFDAFIIRYYIDFVECQLMFLKSATSCSTYSRHITTLLPLYSLLPNAFPLFGLVCAPLRVPLSRAV